MSRTEVHIPIPENAIEVKVPGYMGTYFVKPDPAGPELTWVANVLGTDGASYRFTPDEVIMTSLSLYDRYHKNKETIFKNPSKEFWQWQKMLQQILDLATAEGSKPIERQVEDVAEFVEAMNSYVPPESLWREIHETDSVQAPDSSNKQEPKTEQS